MSAISVNSSFVMPWMNTMGRNTQTVVRVEAVMDSGIRIPKPKEVNLATVSNVSVDALAAAAGAGAVSINAGLALALNRITQNTGAKSGAATGYENPAAIDFFKNNDAPPNLNVTADSNTAANSYILGVAIGGGAATLNAAVSDVDADINTFIGEGLSDGHGHDFDPLLILADKLVITHNSTTLDPDTDYIVTFSQPPCGGRRLTAPL